MNTNARQIGKYTLQELLGHRTLTQVWKAIDTQQNRYVAIKLFYPQLQTDSDFVNRFFHEMPTIASLQHPHIVLIHDFQVSQPPASEQLTPYVVMDYVEGQTLADYIKHTSRIGRFPSPAEVVQLLLPVSAAIDYAHQRGILHLDIHPGSILLGKTAHTNIPTPLLTNFGTMKLLRMPSPSLNSAFYASPERAQGYIGNERSDLYSLGMILYEMFTGTLPFEGDNPTDVLTQQINTAPTPPALINPNILPPVTGVIMRSLAKDPAVRYSSANAMIGSLARALNISVTAMLSQSGNPMDTMDSPTYITPTLSPRMTPSPSSPLLPAVSTNSQQTPPISMTPVTYRGNVSGPIPSIQPAVDRSIPSQTHAALQSPEPITPMPPVLPSRHSLPSLPATTPVQPPPVASPQKRRRRTLFIALIALLIIVLVSSALGTYLAFFPRGNTVEGIPPTIPIIGHAFFISSGLLSPNPDSSQGITDQLQINLQKLPPPQPGKSYYAWLLNNKTLELNPIFLGKLALNSDGTAGLTYTGDAAHSDLLANNSRFLISEDDASAPPPSPSLDPNTWSYYAEFSEKPNPLDPKRYSLYNHIQHLLAADPKLKDVGLTGGLDIWLFRNTEKILEWSGSARDSWKNQNTSSADFIRRQLTRILAYLDGSTYLQTDLPGVPLRVDPTIAKVALLEFDAQRQEPPGYLFHIGTKHLHEVTRLSDATPAQKALAIQISEAIDNVNTWLQIVRADAIKLYNMTDSQLLGADGRSLLDDLATQANNAFVGQINPYTHQVKEGVVQIHYNIQRLATFDIRACTSSHPCTL